MTPERRAYEEFMAAAQEAQQDLHATVEDLVRLAASHGFIITVETVPLQPLRMGNYDLEVSVRPSRPTYQEEARLLAAAIESEKEKP